MVKGPFSVETTTTRLLKESLACISSALDDCAIDYDLADHVFSCTLELASPPHLSFTIEICRLKRISLLGINFTRIDGEPWVYKRQIQILLAKMRL